jgi:hypothetical protein
VTKSRGMKWAENLESKCGEEKKTRTQFYLENLKEEDCWEDIDIVGRLLK